MKIFSAAQLHAWDTYTILHEPIASIDLMERAAIQCAQWITHNLDIRSYQLFCGTGNNGGDGLAIARLLKRAGGTVEVYVLEGSARSNDFHLNLERLKKEGIAYSLLTPNHLPAISPQSVVIDALFGSGLNRPLTDLAAAIVNHINHSQATVVSIDLPSGMPADSFANDQVTVQAAHTLSFQTYKFAFMLPEQAPFAGNIHLLDIGLHSTFYDQATVNYYTTDLPLIQRIYQPRNRFAHKYNFGHAFLYCGSKQMMGAAILCAKAVLRAGTGLVTVYTEQGTQAILQTAFPEAITTTEASPEKNLVKKQAVGIGPGLEDTPDNSRLLQAILLRDKEPLVIDATALTMLADYLSLLHTRKQFPALLTPHTGEFDRLFGISATSADRLLLATEKAVELHCYIILKGHYTYIACPDGKGYFNTTGNAGMATAGSGDVLTGILTGLLAQGYDPLHASLLGVYLHGKAGDVAAQQWSQEAMISGDIIDHLGTAFKQVQS